MKSYESPEVVEIGKADDVILGVKIGTDFDNVGHDFIFPAASVIDVD